VLSPLAAIDAEVMQQIGDVRPQQAKPSVQSNGSRLPVINANIIVHGALPGFPSRRRCSVCAPLYARLYA